MNLGRSIMLTVTGALLIGCGQKALFMTKSSAMQPSDRAVQTVIFKPKQPKLKMQTVVYRPDLKKPAKSEPVVAAVDPADETAQTETASVIVNPEDSKLGEVKPRLRILSGLGDILKPRARGETKTDEDGVVTASIRPAARTRTVETASKETVTAKADPSLTEKPAVKPAETIEASLKIDEPKVTNPGRINIAPYKTSSVSCGRNLSAKMPSRRSNALSGSEVVRKTMSLSGAGRDSFVSAQILGGNMPDFLRHLIPVTFNGKTSGGQQVEVVVCVTPDYLAVGSDRDFVRVPMGLPAAAMVADKFNFLLPTTKMVDAIYAQANVQMRPAPMQPGAQMSTTSYLWEHNQTVNAQRVALSRNQDLLTAGQKKDLVLSNRLRSAPGRVAIYGWHRGNGAPIQPLSTVHGALYADYSHGIRLVSATAYVNGRAVPLEDVLQDPQLAAFVSKEGPIARPRRLMASLYH